MAQLYTETELKKKTVADLRTLMGEHGWEDFEELKKADLIENLLTEQAPEDDEVEDDEEVDDAPADEVDDEEEDDEELELPAPDEEEDEVEEEAPAAKPKRTRAAAGEKAPAKPRATKAVADGESTLAAKQIATILKTEPKTLRQFFRSDASTVEAVGSGGRYEFAESDVPKIKSEFETWKSAHGSRGTKRTKGETPADEVEEVETIDEIEELEEDDTKAAPATDEIDDEEIDDDDLELDE